ncbi:MAG: response regulator [Chloroflexi bacterium]|nr:response regulator [Chloroflexota bacterium]
MVRQRRVLLADDEASIRRFVGVGLRAEGFEVTEAVNGEEAIRAVEKSSPDLVLLDIRMPKVDGFEVCRRIRVWSRVPIIMLSAMSDPMDKAKSLTLGADDYLVKPFSIDELTARIRAVLRRSSLGQ